MRLFAAVLPPEAALAELARAVEALPAHPGLRWTGPDGRHLTVAFYGDVPQESLPELAARLARAAGHTAPFDLALRGGGRFGGRTLWAGVAGDAAVLRRLAARAQAAARKAGLDTAAHTGHRRYHPHVTLARGRTELDLGPYVTALDGFAGTAWTVRELVLVRSELPRSGVPGEQPRYETSAAWPLSGTR
ncbi:RNA 2',3'-cyclic phosphodiesterase [Streptomyces beihaiensis]|uniref:RNA 2',3'-cyclic phosphodiesterase n=1 Tax=Streptomyces beihaiensis TaxID=2984495 RepID=A0ABT3U3K2_9ACTN|nr:RNA 2',3'-cyclic phosphodiesterase [Streptomyces beihaiensis]MCX3063615.1 RNA 2',3'-cyclic phosphodiesterase [Streptomyces beihaiensis]